MEFKFSCPDEDITKTLAFAIDKDCNVQIAHNSDPIDTHTMAEILGMAIDDVLENSGEIDKQDDVQNVARIFLSALGCSPHAISWIKVKDDLPTLNERKVFFVLKGQNQYEEPHNGYYDYLDNVFHDNDGTKYPAGDVVCWMPYPKVPIQKGE